MADLRNIVLPASVEEANRIYADALRRWVAELIEADHAAALMEETTRMGNIEQA